MNVKVLEGDYLDATSTDPDLDAAFQAFRDEIADGETLEGTISAYKLPMDREGNVIAKSKKQAFLFTCPTGGVSLIDIITRIKRDFIRPGETAITVRLAGNRPGRRGSEFNKILYIERENEAAAAPVSSSPDIIQMLRAMQEMNAQAIQRQESFTQRLLEMQLQIAQARQPVGTAPAVSSDPMVMMEKMMLMQTMMSKFAAITNAPATAATATDPMTQLLGTLKMMKEVQSFMGTGGAESDDNSFAGILKALAPIAAPGLTLLAENARNARARAPAQLPRAAPAKAAPSAPTAEAQLVSESQEENTDMFMSLLRPQLKTLCEMAAEGTDAAAAADLVMDQVPDSADGFLSDLVSDENASLFQGKITALCADCKNHAEWFEQLRVCLDSYYTDPDNKPS